MDTNRICPICGKPLALSTPEGLCPKCLLKAGLGTGADMGPDTGGKMPRFTPPKIEELAAKFPQLDILELIGQGGMGAVYKARQKELDRVVALKILPPQAGGAAFAERFTREARALAKLNHPHIVTLYEFGQSDGLFYFLMEFVDGVNLRQLLRNSRVSPREALAIVPQICEALQFAHDSGIVHRDIKPENILLDKKGLVKIADFGVAKMIAESLTQAAEKTAPATGELTEAGATLGTPQYMAPEQIKNSAEVDHRADIYSLGVVFYQMLTGELPSGKIEPPSSRMRGMQIDMRLDEIVLRALENKPELRFQQASEVKTAVETIVAVPQPAPHETAPVRIEPINNPKAARRFGAASVIAFLAIILAPIAILLCVETSQPKVQNKLSEAAFLQKFDSNQIAEATITYPSRAGGAATINGKFIETDANGNTVEQNGQPADESFITSNIVLTPRMEDKLLASKKIKINMPNPVVSDLAYQLLFYLFPPIALSLFMIVIIFFLVRKTRGPPVIPEPGAGPMSVPNRRGWLRPFFITLLAAIVVAFILCKFVIAPHRAGMAGTDLFFHFRVFEADADLVDQLIPSIGNFHIITHGAMTDSQTAPVSPLVVHSLLQNMAAEPGLLVDQTRVVSGSWRQIASAASPVGWHYGISDASLLGGGSGSATFGVRKNNDAVQVRIDGWLNHTIDTACSGVHFSLNSGFFYEGPLPQTNELAFLTPFTRHDGSQHYLVTVFDFNGQSSKENPKLVFSGPPFTAQLHQASVELALVGDEPWTNPDCWYPNGQPSPKAFPTGNSESNFTLSGMKVKKLVFYIRNQSTNGVSVPICSVDSQSGAFNSSSIWQAPQDFDYKGYLGMILACPTNAMTANLSIGVANGPWETVVSMDHFPGTISADGLGDNNWSGAYESVAGSNNDVAVGCTYTTRSNWVSRIIYVDDNGKIAPISERSNPGGFSNPATGTLLISSNEYRHIKQFLVQRRNFQWVEFDNISLKQGRLTSVTAKSN